MTPLNRSHTIECDYMNFREFYDFPCHIYVKDINGTIIDCNDHQAKNAGYKKVEDLIGLNDHDFTAKLDAIEVHNNDKSIMLKEKTHIFIEDVKYVKNNKMISHCQYISCKKPYYSSSNKVIGMSGISFNVNDMIDDKISKTNPLAGFLLEFLYQHLLKTTIMRKKIKSLLSPQQYSCLIFLLSGKTNKEIANCMELSVRTVEYYTEIIKNKLGCSNKNEIIKLIMTDTLPLN